MTSQGPAVKKKFRLMENYCTYFPNLVNPNQSRIVITLFRKMVIIIQIWSGLTRFRKDFSLCNVFVDCFAKFPNTQRNLFLITFKSKEIFSW